VAVTVSGLFVLNWIDIVDASQLAVDLSLTTNKVALFTNTITPNYSTDTAYAVAPYNANEISGTGYTAGGAAVASPTITESPTGTLMYDLADVSWTTSTITNARCSLFYANALAPKAAICLVNFGADYSTSAGTFTIQWAAGGMFNIDLTP
jgi:hypothetical protein